MSAARNLWYVMVSVNLIDTYIEHRVWIYDYRCISVYRSRKSKAQKRDGRYVISFLAKIKLLCGRVPKSQGLIWFCQFRYLSK